mmetsp:Transcript_30113/g.65714  ORF Transcript_30113/g.65714 Transcript_30113/m.65714 type:complete len:375 (-) Transcript_30113:178-1302(-)
MTRGFGLQDQGSRGFGSQDQGSQAEPHGRPVEVFQEVSGLSASGRRDQRTVHDVSKSQLEDDLTTVVAESDWWGDDSVVKVPGLYERPKPLLEVTPPTDHALQAGKYVIFLRRAALSQPFGINFSVRGSVIQVAEEHIHLGLHRGDQLVQLNRREPEGMEECRDILGQSLMVELVLKHRDPGPEVNEEDERGVALTRFSCALQRPTGILISSQWACCVADSQAQRLRESVPKKPFRTLLAVSAVRVVDFARGEFQISLYRTSPKQRFGISFIVTSTQPLEISICEDLPHMSLRKGDRLITLNGVRPTAASMCQKILDSSMTVKLILSRGTAWTQEDSLVDGVDTSIAPALTYEVAADATRDPGCPQPLWCEIAR